MASFRGRSKHAALATVMAAMALGTACDPKSKPPVVEPATWAGNPMLRARAKDSPVIYVKFDLAAFLAPDTKRINLPLPEGTSIVIEKTGEESRGERKLVWKGKIKGEESGVATFATSYGILAGNIISSKGKMYRVDQVAPGLQVVYVIDRNLFPSEAQPLRAREAIGLPQEGPGSNGCPADNAQNIEVMVVYTAAACGAAPLDNPSGACSMEAQQKIENDILAIQGETNTTFSNSYPTASSSDATPQVSLVRVGLIGEYAESNDLVKELARVRLTGDSEMEDQGTQTAYIDDVVQWRDQYRADVVALITRPAGAVADGPACGASTLMGDNKDWFEKYAYMVVPVDCMNLNQSLTHELGHLMGAGHESPTPSQSTIFSSNNRAHVQLNPSKSGVLPWRTVMAQNNSSCMDRNLTGCGRVLHFSNPNVNHEDDPTGSDEENNSEVVSATAGTVARFRRALSCDSQ